MSLKDEVKKLRGLEQQATSGKWQAYYGCVRSKIPTELIDGPLCITTEYTPIAEFRIGIDQKNEKSDSEFVAANRNLAPAMLAALSMIQAGDAKDLSWVAEFFEADCEPEGDRIAAVIRRYEHMAALMEQEGQG